jgi:hypothetical protein
MNAVEFSDFSRLSIGGAAGTTIWTNTPTPIVGRGWVEWRGIYTPSMADVGSPFRFAMTVDINRRHSLAIDGLMTADVPEPASALGATIFASCLGLWRFSQRRWIRNVD